MPPHWAASSSNLHQFPGQPQQREASRDRQRQTLGPPTKGEGAVGDPAQNNGPFSHSQLHPGPQMEHIRGRGLPSLLAGGQLPGLTSSQPKAGPGLPPRGPNTQYRKMFQDNRASDGSESTRLGNNENHYHTIPGASHRKKNGKESSPPFLNLDKQHLPRAFPQQAKIMQ